MAVIEGDGIAISYTAGARQMVIFSHGGWKTKSRWRSRSGDGWITCPPNAEFRFYSVDGQFTIGNRVYDEVFADPAAAYAGTLPAARFPHQQRCTEGQGIKDYALYTDDRPNASNYWRGHTSAAGPFYDPDVDVAMITVTGHKRHVSDVIDLATSNGLAHDRYHAAFCRVDR